MEYFTKRNLDDYNNKLKSDFALLSVAGKYRVIGSGSYKSVRYNNDYDLAETYTKTKLSKSILDEVLKIFQEKFRVVENNPNLYITDFKCGIDSDGEALRWDKDDMKKGVKILKNGRMMTFQEILLTKSVIKLDMVDYLDGYFTEISEMYFFKFGDHTNYHEDELDKEHLLVALKVATNEYLNEGNYFKALKRLFSYISIKDENKYKKEAMELIDFFNTSVGLIYKAKSELDTLLLVLNNKFRKPALKDIFNTLQIIKQNLSGVFDIPLKDVTTKIDKICLYNSYSKVESEIEELRDYLFKIASEQSLDFISKNKNLFI
jgi:hypothetical protein